MANRNSIRKIPTNDQRCCERRSVDSTPVHKRAFGVFANPDIRSQDLITGTVMTLMPEVIDTLGLNYDTLRKHETVKPKETPRLTVMPLAPIGKEMTRRQSGLSQNAYKNLHRDCANVLGKISVTGLRLPIHSVGWYGDHSNVLVAKLDTNTSTYETLNDIQAQLRVPLARVGIEGALLYPVDHITLARFGPKKHPLELDDEHKAHAEQVFAERLLNVPDLALSGLSTIDYFNTENHIKPHRDPFLPGFGFSNEIG